MFRSVSHRVGSCFTGARAFSLFLATATLSLFFLFSTMKAYYTTSHLLTWKKKNQKKRRERERERESSCFELWWEVTRLTHRTDKSAPSNSQPARPSLRAPPVSATVQSPCPGPSRIVCAPKPKTTLGWLDRSGRVGKLPREPLDRVVRRSRPSIARALCSFRRLTVAIRESYVDVEEEHVDTCIFRDSYSRTSTEYSTNFCSYVHVGDTASYTYTRTAAPRQYVDVRSAGPTGRHVCVWLRLFPAGGRKQQTAATDLVPRRLHNWRGRRQRGHDTRMWPRPTLWGGGPTCQCLLLLRARV